MPFSCTPVWWFYSWPETIPNYPAFGEKSWKNLVGITSKQCTQWKSEVCPPARTPIKPHHGQTRLQMFCIFQVSPVLFRALNTRSILQVWTCRCLGCKSRRNVTFCSLFRGGKTLIENDMVEVLNFRPTEIWGQTLITSILHTSLGPVLAPLWMEEAQEDWISHF